MILNLDIQIYILPLVLYCNAHLVYTFWFDYSLQLHLHLNRSPTPDEISPRVNRLKVFISDSTFALPLGCAVPGRISFDIIVVRFRRTTVISSGLLESYSERTGRGCFSILSGGRCSRSSPEFLSSGFERTSGGCFSVSPSGRSSSCPGFLSSGLDRTGVVRLLSLAGCCNEFRECGC